MSTDRTTVHRGICAYFGGTENTLTKCWQNGPLVSNGLGTVKLTWPKRVNDADFTFGMPAGRSMGALMIVHLGFSQIVRRSKGGPPVGPSGALTAGGIKFKQYRATLRGYHMAQKGYDEDAMADVDMLTQAIEDFIEADRTLGGICTDSGNIGRFGIQTTIGEPGYDANERTGITFQIAFELLTQHIG